MAEKETNAFVKNSVLNLEECFSRLRESRNSVNDDLK